MIRALLATVWALSAFTAWGLERIVVSQDGKGFVLAGSGKPFVPWGVNYGNAGRLMEDFWDAEWSTIEGDFAEIKAMGGNVVRIHLQYGKFMEAVDRPNAGAFRQLRRMIETADRAGLYLDITGLACYRPSDVPKWYEALDEDARWKAQAFFWRAVAAECAGKPAVFCYDLMNEPVVPGKKAEKWSSGHLFGGYDFLQHIVLDLKDRARMDVAAAWIDTLSRAIREADKDTLITVGMLPWVTGWQHLSGFIPKDVAKHVDFLSVHIYPKTKQPDEAPRALSECVADKPVVIEETFPLECSVEELEAFLRASRSSASGWIWHYDGTPVAEYDAMQKAGVLTPVQGVWRAALRSFARLQPEFTAGSR